MTLVLVGRGRSISTAVAAPVKIRHSVVAFICVVAPHIYFERK